MSFMPRFSQQSRCATRWCIALAAIALWMVSIPGTVWAGDGDAGCDEAPRSPKEVGVTLAPAEPAPLPCQASSYDSPSYNVCFAANPQPMSTMPKWITGQQARDAVGIVLEEVHGLHRPSGEVSDNAHRPLWHVAAPTWLDEVIEEIERSRLPLNRGSMCIETPGEDHCEQLPSHAVTASAGATTPVFRWAPRFHVPWRPDDNAEMQSPVVDLRVGPSAEHRRLPERPPPA